MRADRGRMIHYALLLMMLAWGLGISLARIDYNSVFVDEAYHIVMGRQLAAGEYCPGCPAHTGSVMTWPLFASFADSAWGLNGARIMNVVLGLVLTLFIYAAARLLLGKRCGLLAAGVFIFSGQALYLMKLATYDMTAAFFLGGALLSAVAAEKVGDGRLRYAALASASLLLCLAAVTKYLIPAYMPFFVIWVVWRYGITRAMAFTVFPIVAFMTIFFLYSPYPPNPSVLYQIEEVREVSRLPLVTIMDWTFRWVALTYLLSVFGLFHGKHRSRAAVLMVFSTPILLIHLITRAEHSVNKNVVFALIFLAPAAALGIDHISHIFAMKSRSRGVRLFFTSAVLAIVWSYGLYNLGWLEKQHPDVTQVIEYFERRGFDGMTVATNGWDGVMYEYALEGRYSDIRFDHITWFIEECGEGRSLDERVDFVVCEDDYYGKHYPSARFGDVLERDCTLLEDFTISHSWGESHALVFGRRR